MRLPIGTPFLGAFLLSLSLSLDKSNGVAFNNLFKQIHRVWIGNLLAEKTVQNTVVNAIKELSHVTLQGKAMASVILTHCTKSTRQICNALMRALADSAGERGWYKRRLKDGVQHLKQRMVEHPIADGCLVDTAQFGITNPEAAVGSVVVFFGTQFSSEFKNFRFNILLKPLYIKPVPFVAFENIPRLEQILCRGYPTI